VNRGLVGTSLDIADWKVLLPTEAQWEYGARAGGQGDYFRGKGKSRVSEVMEKTLSKYAHYGKAIDTGKTQPVREHDKNPNAWGLELILGNAFQRVYDGYQDGLRGGKDPVEHNDDNGEAGGLRAYRGGCWNFYASYCRSADRRKVDPTYRNPFSSLRLAISSSGVYGSVQEEKK